MMYPFVPTRLMPEFDFDAIALLGVYTHSSMFHQCIAFERGPCNKWLNSVLDVWMTLEAYACMHGMVFPT